MRSALALLVTISGCNWVFGLGPTEINDGGDGTDSPPAIRTKLVWATPGGPALIAPDPPMIQVGEPLGGTPLMQVTYDDSGTFPIPYMLREAPHRIVFTMPGETIAHEYQWSISGATITVPRPSRAGAPVVPTGSGYSIMPTGATTPPLDPVILTTGVATFSHAPSPSNTTTKFLFSNASPLAGPLGAPEGSKGDKVILGEWIFRGGGLSTFDGYAIASIDLQPGALTDATPAWKTSTRTMTTASSTDPLPVVPAVDAAARLPAGTQTRYMSYGISPGLALPGFIDGKPMVLPFAESTEFATSVMCADPTRDLTDADRVFAARMSTTRMVAGAALTSSVATVTNQFSAQMKFAAPLAQNVKLNTTSLAADTTFAPSSQAASLKWDAEAGQTAHLYTVTLFEIANANLSALRIYHVLTPAVAIDGSLLQTGHQYTFAITADNGYTNASQGDFKVVSYPFSESTTFSGAFTVQ